MGSKKSTTTSGTDLPDFVTTAGQTATQMGSDIAGRAYTPYTGRRVADLSGNETQAMNLAAAGNGRAQQYIDQGTNLLAAGKNWDEATDAERKSYEEPIFQQITRPALDNANKVYDTARTNLTTNKALISAKGQDQYNLQERALDRNIGQATSDITAQGRYQAYDAARAQWGQDQERMQRAAEAYRAVGGDITRLNAQQIQDLMMTGGAQRLAEQQNLDFDYGQFLENRDWSVSNLEPLLKALQGTAGAYDYSESGKKKESGGELGQILGAATSIAGAYYGGGFGGLGGVPKSVGIGTGMSDWANSGGPINLINGNTPGYMVG